MTRTALYLCLACSLLTLARQGYPLLCLALLPLLLLCCRPVKRAGGAPTAVTWRAGEWAVEAGGSSAPVTVELTSVTSPWCIYLAWTVRDGGCRGSVWLFPDSAPTRQLRQLRVRLKLES